MTSVRKLGVKLPSTYDLSLAAYQQRAVLTPARLRTLKKGAVPAKGVLNPYGRAGCSKIDNRDNECLRPQAMKRKRLRLNEEKFKALEAHEVQRLARESAESAIKTLKEICTNKRAPEATRIAASSVLLDRGYGKASQTSITANLTNGKTSDLTSDEIERRTQLALKRVEELTNRAPKAGKSQKGPVDLRKYN